MPDITTTTQLSDSLRAQYESDYVEAALPIRTYDQIAEPLPGDLSMADITKGSSVVVPFLSDLAPSDTAISQTVDIDPVTFEDTTTSISPTSRANYVKTSEQLMNQAYTNFGSAYYKRVGENMMESVDLIAKDVAIGCSLVRYGSHGSRSTLDAGTADDLLTMGMFAYAGTVLNTMRAPMFDTLTGTKGVAIVHPFAWADFCQADTKWIAAAEYQDKSMILNWEAGEVLGFKVIVSPYAKVLWGAGVANASAIATTTTAASKALDKVIYATVNTDMHVGDHIMIGTIESSTTFYGTNEYATIISVSSLTIGVVGMGHNGGLRYAHASGATISNADNVAAVIFAGKGSLKKIYDTNTGEFGTVVGPYLDGAVRQWANLGWKWRGNYGRISESWLLRQECALGIDTTG
jgi:N4-gp56 family major capsid protein